jgi:hypothetical protein
MKIAGKYNEISLYLFDILFERLWSECMEGRWNAQKETILQTWKQRNVLCEWKGTRFDLYSSI